VPDISTGSVLPRAVAATRSLRTARLTCSRRAYDEPVPEETDITATGIVDLRDGRAWLQYGAFTKRMVASMEDQRPPRFNLIGRLQGRVILRMARRSAERPNQLYHDGENWWIRKPTGRWKHSWARPGSAAYLHPLWLFGPFSRIQTGLDAVSLDEQVSGTRTTRYVVDLTEELVGSSGWEQLADLRWPEPGTDRSKWDPPDHPVRRSAVPACAWIDDDGVIRRMGFESAKYELPERGTWTTVEFSDFGVSIDGLAVPSAADRDE
jgi:hypothetical protein